uniref:Uncharacterized protein n=1 Tax=Euplotes harpa TaxID=151035 RepID=A0A7S3J698_9SPIT|mmetsp:Transcript_19443/g.22646  ORF Transcript_19443/g.22646 Transcript_19443/m.22646 type:complete len:151 (+) Transcript_19443:618-1070(+)
MDSEQAKLQDQENFNREALTMEKEILVKSQLEESRKRNEIIENQKALQIQIFEKKKAKEISKLVDKNELIVLKSSMQKFDSASQKEREAKYNEKKRYREILDQQLKQSKEIRQYGNMTQVEKKLNKYDLYAYKHNDNNQYSLIPGFNSLK